MLKNQEKVRFSAWFIRQNGQKQFAHYNVWYSNMLRELHEAVKNDTDFDPVKFGVGITSMDEAYQEVFKYMSEDEINDISMVDPTQVQEDADYDEDSYGNVAEEGDEAQEDHDEDDELKQRLSDLLEAEQNNSN
jgi:hypothetical protein